MPNLIDYMPIFIPLLAAAFLIPLFISIARSMKRDKKYAGQSVSIAKLPKRFEMVDGRTVVAFPCALYMEPHKASAIITAMAAGTTICDANGNEYAVIEYLKGYSSRRHIFRDSQNYLLFSIRATGGWSVAVESALTFEQFNRENVKRKALVKAGELSKESYTEWLEQQLATIKQ